MDSLGRIGQVYNYRLPNDKSGKRIFIDYDFQAPVVVQCAAHIANNESMELWKKIGRTVYISRGSKPEYIPTEYWIVRSSGPYEGYKGILYYRATVIDICLPGRNRKAFVAFEETYVQMVLDNSSDV